MRRPPQQFRPWTDAEMAALAEGLGAGRSVEELAVELGRSVDAVRIRRNRFLPPVERPNRFGSAPLGNRRWWTRERTLEGLRDFARRNRGQLPTSDHLYSLAKKGHMEWPPATRVLEFFGTMAGAWEAAGASRARYTRGWVAWTQDDDDYLLEHAGEQTLKVIAKHLGRSWAACKRRLYDLGAGRARDVSGHLSAAQVAQEYGCPQGRVIQLIKAGELRASRVRGGHYWRIAPEDLKAVEPKLRAPKRTHRASEPHAGDYRRRNGLRRVRDADGRLREVAANERGARVLRAKRDKKRFAAAMRVAVQLMEDEGLVIDLGVAS